MTEHTESGSLLDSYDGLVCDLDGVVYRGDDAVPGAPEALRDMVIRGTRVVYATNNASRVPAEVAAHVQALGAPATSDDVVSSAEAGAARLRGDLPPGAAVLALGGAGVVEALGCVGLVPVAPADVFGASPREVSAVLQGFGRGLRVADFEIAARVLTSGVPWVATNDDATLPLPWGESPGNGAYVDLLAATSGRRPVVVGKPHPPLYRLALERLGTAAHRTLAVGDRLGTDILGAMAAGLDSAWVLTGVDRPSDLLISEARPTYVIGSLTDLFQPYAVPVRQGSAWRCGGAVAELTEDALEVQRGSASVVEAVRAGIAALGDGPPEDGESARRRGAAVLDRLLGLSSPANG